MYGTNGTLRGGILTDRKLFRKVAFITLILTFPFFSGFLDVYQAAQAQTAGPENQAYELRRGAWSATALEAVGSDRPLDIFEHVRTRIAYEPYRGVRKGAEVTWHSGRGNDFDQAMLLATLLEEANVPWRLVQGDVSLKFSDAQKWLGISGASEMAALLRNSGIACRMLPGQSVAPSQVILPEHVWVQVRGDFFPMQGAELDDRATASQTADPAESWVDLDPSITLHQAFKPVDLTSATAMVPSTVLASLNPLSATTDGGGEEVANVDGEKAESAGVQAGERLESHVRSNGLDPADLGKLTGGFLMPRRETMPATTLAEQVSGIRTLDDSNPGALVQFLKENRETVRVFLSEGSSAHGWESVGTARLGTEALTLAFRVSDDPRHADNTTGLATAEAVDLVSGSPAEPLCTLDSMLLIGDEPVVATSSRQYAYGERLTLRIESEAAGSLVPVVTEIPVVAGGVYAICPHDMLSNDSAATFEDGLLEEEISPLELYRLSLGLAGAGANRSRTVGETSVLSSGGRCVARAALRGTVAGYEPALTATQATDVRLVLHGFGERGIATAVAANAPIGSSEAAQLQVMLEDVAFAPVLKGLGAHAGWQTAGRLLALKDEVDASKLAPFRRYARNENGTGATFSAGHVPTVAGGEVLESALIRGIRGGATLLSRAEDFADRELAPGVPVGFALWSRGADGAAAGTLEADFVHSAALTPDGALRTAWTNMALVEPTYAPFLFPVQLLVPASGTYGSGAYSETLEANATLLSRDILGTANGQSAGLAGAGLLVAPWLHPEAWQAGPWKGAVPAAFTALFGASEAFARPRVKSFELSPYLVNTADVEDPGDENFVNAAGSLTATATVSRPSAVFFDIVCPPDDISVVSSNPGSTEFEHTWITTEDPEQELYSLHRLGISGRYEVKAWAELGQSLSSDVESRFVEVDNTPPTVSLTAIPNAVRDAVDVKGIATDDHFTSWTLQYLPPEGVDDDDLVDISGGTGDRPVGVESTLVRINTRKLGWNGDYELVLRAVDAAGNRSTARTVVAAANDLVAPLVAIAGIEDGGALYHDSVKVDLEVTDPESAPSVPGSKIVGARMWIEAASDPSRKLELFSWKNAAGLQQVVASQKAIDTALLDRAVPDEKWTLKAEAFDAEGNRGEDVIRDIVVQELLWDFKATPAQTLAIDDGRRVYLTGELSQSAPWTIKIHEFDVESGQHRPTPLLKTLASPAGSTRRDIYEYWDLKRPGGGFAGKGMYHAEIEIENPAAPGGIEKGFARFALIEPGGNANQHGPCIVRLQTDRGDWQDDFTAALPTDPEELDDYIAADDAAPRLDVRPEDSAECVAGGGRATVQTNFMITQGSKDPILVFAQLGSMFEPYLDGGPMVEMPPPVWFGAGTGYEDAFWALEFKSSAVAPTIDDILSGRNSDTNLTKRDQWHTIKWGNGLPGIDCCDPNTMLEAENALAAWDTSSLPEGYYDVRLWITNGLQHVHHVLGGLKVVPPGIPGTNDGPGDVGALTLSSTDMSIPFNGITAQIARDYNSRDVYEPGPLGFGWTLRGISLDIDHQRDTSADIDEAFITLPDGREFWFANSPPASFSGAALAMNPWVSKGEYLQRPFGMRLYRPGAANQYWSDEFLQNLIPYTGNTVMLAPGRSMPEQYTRESRTWNKGQVAYLQTEDHTWYIFEWFTGDLLEIVKPDGQVTIFEKATGGATFAGDQLSPELRIYDTSGRSITIHRDPNNGRIHGVEDPNGHMVEYIYDKNDHGNLETVRDRRGFERYYIYDTPENMAWFAANLPGEDIDFTGLHPHRIVDIRIDDDRDGTSHFAADVVPNVSAMDRIAREKATLGTQNFPGDTSIMGIRYEGDNVVAYETGAGNVGLEYEEGTDGEGEPDGSGYVTIVDETTGAKQKVKYDDRGRVMRKKDVYGFEKVYDYSDSMTDESGEPVNVDGLLASETDEMGNVTSYRYAKPADPDSGNMEEQLRDFINRRIACGGTLYVEAPACENMVNADAPGYLTSSQIQPTVITQESMTGDPIMTRIEYAMQSVPVNHDGPPEQLQPTKVWDPLSIAKAGWEPNGQHLDPDGATQLVYNDQGQMTGVIPPQGAERAVTTLYYGQGDLPSGESAPGTDAIYTTVKIDGRIWKTLSPDGEFTLYGYKVYPGGGAFQYEEQAVYSSQSESWFYTRVDAMGRAFESWSAEGESTPAPGSKGSPGSAEYTAGEAERTFTEYDAEGRVTASVNMADGSGTVTDYDWQGRAVRTASVPAEIEGVESHVVYSHTEYDDLGRVSRTWTETDDGRTLSSDSTQYLTLPEGASEGDASGRLERRIDMRGTISESQQDIGGRLVVSRRILADGRLAEETRYKYDPLGRQVEVSTIDGVVSTTEYDEFGRTKRTASTMTVGGVTVLTAESEFGYDAGGRQIFVKTLSGFTGPNEGTAVHSWTVNEYNEDGSLFRTYVNQTDAPTFDPDGTLTSIADPDKYREYRYDGEGRRVAEAESYAVDGGDAKTRWTYTHYNATGQVASVIMNFVNATYTSDEDADALTTVQVDALAHSGDYDDDNLRFDFLYDADGRQTAIVKPMDQVLEKVYDDEGRLLLDLGPVNDDANGPGNGNRQVKWFAYDDDGRVDVEYRGVVDGAIAPDEIDPLADIVEKARIEFDYHPDWGGVAEKRVFQNGVLERKEVHSYGGDYGDLLRIETFDGPTGALTHRVAYEHELATGYLSAVVSMEGRIEYTRDARGRLVRLRTSTGIDTEYRYDALGRIEKLIDRGLAGSASAAGEIAFKYDALGRKKEVVRPNGTKSVYGYDPLAGWTASIAHLAPNGDNQLRLDYERDFTGIIDGIVEKHGAALDEQEWAYAYDGLKRLETAERTWTGTGGAAGVRYGYEYDRNGNRHSETVETYDNIAAQWNVSTSDVYGYNALDQLTTKTAGAGAGTATTYAWTALGQLHTETLGDVVKTFGWSGDDRMLSVAQATDEDPDWSVAYAYDHRGERVGRKEANGSGASTDSRRFLSDGENSTGYTQALAEVSADGLATKANYWYADGFGPVAQVHDPSSPQFDVRFLLGDHLSTTRGLTDSQGVASLYGYEPFGKIASGDGSLTSYAFTGQWRDATSELQHHRARWYDAGVGRWGSVDPVWDWPKGFASRYAYAGSNPNNHHDSFGRFTMLEVQVVLGIVSDIVSRDFEAIHQQLEENDEFKDSDATKITGIAVLIFGIIALASLVISLGPLVIKFITKLPQIISKGPAAARAVFTFLKHIRHGRNHVKLIGRAGASWGDLVSDAGFVTRLALQRNPRRIVLAQTHNTCGPTSVMMAIETKMGKHLDDVQDFAKTEFPGIDFDQAGSTAYQWVDVLRKHGVANARRVTSNANASVDALKDATKHGDPVIAVVNNFNTQGISRHAIVVDGFTTKQGVEVVAVRDPAGGAFFETLESFKNRYLQEAVRMD